MTTGTDIDTPPDNGPRQALIGIVPYGFRPKGRLADVGLAQLVWPLGKPAQMEGRTIGDLEPNDHICAYPKRWLFGRKTRGIKANLSLVIVEPCSIHRRYMRLARLFHRRFHSILTCNTALLAAIPNGVYFVFGDSWVRDWRQIDCSKHRMLSLIASKKHKLEGHKLRHRVAGRLRAGQIDSDIMGWGYKPFARKAEGLAPYRYSIVIENSREPGYFTEKIIDALLLKTVPIYWGAPDIDSFFDRGGIIECTSLDEVMAAVRQTSEQDYQARQEAILLNRKKAIPYCDNLKSIAVVVSHNA